MNSSASILSHARSGLAVQVKCRPNFMLLLPYYRYGALGMSLTSSSYTGTTLQDVSFTSTIDPIMSTYTSSTESLHLL
jgi:hypothetical protein